MGIAGALRRAEFITITTNDVMDGEDLLLVKVRITKNKIIRSFTVSGEFYAICKKYMNARPARCPTDRFFLRFNKDKCTVQPIGINKIGSMPKEIASFLQLPNIAEFSGHSFRRTSATLLVDAGADITALKRHGGWKSNTVAEGYIADSINNKRQVFNQITSGMNLNRVATTANSISNVARLRVESATSPPVSQNESPALPNTILVESSSMNRNPVIRFKKQHGNTSYENLSLVERASQSSTQHTDQILDSSFDIEENVLQVQCSPVKAISMRRYKKLCVDVTCKNSDLVEPELKSSTQHSHEILGTSVILDGDTIVKQQTSKPVESKVEEPKYPVLYDPHVGLYIHDAMEDTTRRPIILKNCHVILHGDSRNNIVLQNCTVLDAKDSEK